LTLPACIVVLDGDSDWGHGHWSSDHSSNALRGSGVSKTETREVGDFRRIEVSSGADFDIQVGPAPSLSVTGDDNLLAYHVTEVRDGTLVVEMKSGSYSPKVRPKMVATVPALESVTVRGSSDMEISGLAGESFAVSVAGSGDIRAIGKVGSVSARITGSGDLDLDELEAREASVEISGSGDVDVWATESMTASISGSGDVGYKGDPPRVTKSVAGSGSVHKK